jgi:isopentenyl diphosphate isomerase/L-lactate dehydrogenase-like FMN-dependent dehydrogenase
MARNRRNFLRFLAASPLAAVAFADGLPGVPDSIITSPKDALNVMDFQEAARKMIPPAHWGYMATGVEDDATLKLNHEAYSHIQLRPRRLIDVSKIDMSVNLFGKTYETPIYLCPVGSQKAFYPAEGELATAKAAKARHHLQVLSTQTSTPVEDVAQALGTPPWYQLYMPLTWDATEKLVRRVEDAGCPVLCWTIDLLGGRDTETSERYRLTDKRDCTTCHNSPRGGSMAKPKPMFSNIPAGFNPPEATWEYVDRLKKFTKMKLILKGIETGEDARLAVEHGVDGIMVSNHGGRANEDLRATIQSLPEVVDAVGGKVPVMVDGGIRRGADVYKALALGATAVGIGRPYIWGLGAFGQAGVERVLELLRAELQLTMKQLGTRSLHEITKNSVVVKF